MGLESPTARTPGGSRNLGPEQELDVASRLSHCSWCPGDGARGENRRGFSPPPTSGPTRSQEEREPGTVVWGGWLPKMTSKGGQGRHPRVIWTPHDWHTTNRWQSQNFRNNHLVIMTCQFISQSFSSLSQSHCPSSSLTVSHLDNRNGFITYFPASTLSHYKMPSTGIDLQIAFVNKAEGVPILTLSWNLVPRGQPQSL